MSRWLCNPSWTLEQRLRHHSTVCPDTGCWLWTAATIRDGYGKLQYKGKTQRAHRLSYQVFVGPIPDGLCVLHSCHTPSCINPSHLRAGTHQDNMDDRGGAGRNVRGERHSLAKLTTADALEVGRMLREGKTQKFIADRFGVSQKIVWNILHGRAWTHVQEEAA